MTKGWEVRRSAVELIAAVLAAVVGGATAVVVPADGLATVVVVVVAGAATVVVVPVAGAATADVVPKVAAVASVTGTCHPAPSTDVRACSHKD